MKTLNRFFYAAMTAFASVALLASCEKDPEPGPGPKPEPEPSEPTQLATPSLSVEDQTNTSFTVTWKAVANADSYTYTLNGGAEETTSATSVEFTSLTAGDYTVKVKATTEDENYTDSEWASTKVTLEEPVEETFTLSAYLQEYGQYTKYNSVWYDATGSGVSAVKYTLMDDNAYSDEDIITLLQQGTQDEGVYSFETDELSALNAGETVSSGFIRLDAETTYEFDFYVTFVSGKSELYREKVTTEAAPAPDENLEQWIGTWTVNSSDTYGWVSAGQGVAPTLLGSPKSGTITISAYGSNQVTIEGWSILGAEYPAVADVSEDGKLQFINNLAIGEADADGYQMMWMAAAELSDGAYTIITGQFAPFTFTLSGNTATSEAYQGDLQDGRTFTCIGYEIYAANLDTGSVSIYDTTTPAFAGNITLTKQTTRPTLYTAQNPTESVRFAPLGLSPYWTTAALSAR